MEKLNELITDFRKVFFKNRVHSLNGVLSSILSELFSRVANIDYLKEIEVNKNNSRIFVQLLVNFITHAKTVEKDNSKLLGDIKSSIFNRKINSFFSIPQKIQLFVILNLKTEHFSLIETNNLEI